MWVFPGYHPIIYSLLVLITKIAYHELNGQIGPITNVLLLS